MKTVTHFFGTRDLARAGAKELNGAFKDFGSTAKKGERWAVLVEAVDIPLVEVEDHEINGIPTEHDLNKQIALLKANIAKNTTPVVLTVSRKAKRTGNVLSRFAKRTFETLKGKKVQAYYKPSLGM